MTVDEQIKVLPPEVEEILTGQEWTKVESRIIRGSICQLMLFY